MPVRNLLRAPRRTVFTLTGIAGAITILVGMFGVLDSTLLTIDRIAGEALQDHPDRMTVYLNSVYPVDTPPVTEITGSPLFSAAEPLLIFPANVMHGGSNLKLYIELLPLDSTLWSPTLIEGRRPTNGPGLLLAEKAAHDLGVKPGDTVILELPRREGLLAYHMVKTEIPVSGIHADPWRDVVYMDRDQAALMGLEGMANAFQVNPAAGVSRGEVKAAMFEQPSVASVIAAHDHVDFFDTAFNEIIKFMSGVVIGVLVLAFLIALNSTNINLSERAREIATLFAFGLPPRTVARMAMLENLLTGLLGTLLGVGAGTLLMFWMIRVRMAAIMVHIQYSFTLSATTLVMTVGIGVVVVALAPLFTIRRMVRMDISSTLRVVE
jgi:putative ABC transport system permease protein